MKLIFSHPTGNANVRAALNGFVEAGMLMQFYTTIATFPGSYLDFMSRLGPFKELSRRRYDSSLMKLTKSSPAKELARLLASKARVNTLTRHEHGIFSVDAVYRSLDRQVSLSLNAANGNSPAGVYAYEDGACHTFTAAKDSGLACFYDLPIGYWRSAKELMEKEKELWPEWAETITGLKDSPKKLQQKDEELRLADCIFVASTFTANTLRSYPGQLGPVNVIPYGFPEVSKSRIFAAKNNGPLKILFVGGLSQRKGIANLFTAVKSFGDKVSLTVVGRKASDSCSALNKELARHTWIPSLPHAQILQLMQQHDVFIFPSLFEGFGLVITEAMSQGTPVITTERTAGPDLINHEENGWLVEAGSTESLINTIENLLLRPSKVVEAGKAAIETAKKRPWNVYGAELAEAVQSFHYVKL